MTLFRRTTPLFALAAAGLATAASGQLINEIRIDQTSTDNDEYFELAGTPGASLAGLSYIVIGDGTGASGVVESALDLTGSVIPASGFFVAAETTFTLSVPDLAPAGNPLNFENSDNVTHMLVSGFTGLLADDLDTNDDGVLDVTPWTSVLDVIALIEEVNPPTLTEFHYGPPTVGPEITGTGIFIPGHVFRSPDGSASLSSWNIGPFDPIVGLDTPGAANAGPVVTGSLGGSQSLILSGGAGNAGDIYLIVGSISGTSPGFPLSATVTLPLNIDLVTTISLQQANGPVFTNTFGTLDGTGGAFASLNLPVLGPGAVGATINLAGVVFDIITFTPDLATNPTACTIL